MRRMTLPEWTPGRAHFGITKLIGFLLLRKRSAEEPRRPGVLTIQAGQNSAEAVVVGLVYLGLLVAGLFHLAAQQTRIAPLTAMLLLVPFIALALFLIHVALGSFALLLLASRRFGLFRGRANHEIQSIACHLSFITLAIISTTQPGRIRLLGAAWLAIVVFELLLRGVALALKSEYAAIDDRFRSEV